MTSKGRLDRSDSKSIIPHIHITNNLPLVASLIAVLRRCLRTKDQGWRGKEGGKEGDGERQDYFVVRNSRSSYGRN